MSGPCTRRFESGSSHRNKQKGVRNVLRWYDFQNKNGATITVKGRFETEARTEAAERWNCEVEDLICTGHTPYNSRQVPEPEKPTGW